MKESLLMEINSYLSKVGRDRVKLGFARLFEYGVSLCSWSRTHRALSLCVSIARSVQSGTLGMPMSDDK